MSVAGGGGIGIVGLLVVLGIGYFFGIDVTPLLQGQGGAPQTVTTELTDADRRAGEFVSVTLADTEEIWTDAFQNQVGQAYVPPTLVLFKGVTQSPCGGASGATGPFYCPGDKKIYLDTQFFTTLEQRMGAGGDFAAAYVVAHEVAHNVQDQLGILGQANRIRAQSGEAQSNAISVRIELQADCLSGVWARSVGDQFGTLERGDIAEAMNAAKQIGDDTLMRNAGRVPMPESFTHGSSEQRQRWFETGYTSGDIQSCDTFSANTL
jgi:predicted metalloprotease